MRLYQQRQILELLQTIKQAQKASLYADCQEGSVSIVSFIESSEGGGTKTGALLDEYYELLYKASNGNISNKFLMKHLTKIENSVKSELCPDRIEIAFLSYNASMSDSIESIYLAAKADPNCDAYWIPIPYYERKADGTLGMLQCDDADCYRSIDCTDWRTYDIEARHPDVIFTFAPYDAGNFVTSVHPDFYCERLRKLTEFLVYVPYFVSIDNVQEHFCTVAGCVFADKVVLQSEKIRDTYIRVFKERYGNRLGKPEEKFVSLGSPKYDKAVNTKCEACDLPKQWSQIIGNKKVVFYNSSVGSILACNEQYLEKLRYVLDIFRSCPDVVLWWRPHPLNEATYKSMRPRLFSEYKQIIESYRREGWGIYDDTPDLHRALVWSDAYYGDWSSVVSMYQATGKAVMICNPDVLSNEMEVKPASICVFENDIWFLARGINALFKINRVTGEPELVGSFPNESNCFLTYMFPLYLRPTMKNGVMYFPPLLANEIATYSVKDNCFEKIIYKDDSTVMSKDFHGAVSYGDYIYFTPRLCPAIVRLNTLTRKVDCYSDWLAPLKLLSSDVQYVLFPTPLVKEEFIVLASCVANSVVMFNMETCQSTVYEVGEKGYCYSGICFDGDNYWLSPRHGTPAVKWNPKTGEAKEFKEPYFCDTSAHSFNPVLYCGGYAWFLPRTAKHAVKIDVHTEVVSIAEEFDFDILQTENEQSSFKYAYGYTSGDSIFAYNEQEEILIQYDCITNEFQRKITCRLPEAEADKLSSVINESFFASDMRSEYDCYYYESKIVRLKDFIGYVVEDIGSDKEIAMCQRRLEIAREANANTDGTAGQAIYDFAKKLILE